jgi:hypothetical protein
VSRSVDAVVLRTTLSKLHIADGVVRISAGLVGILLHLSTQRQNSNELREFAGAVRIVDGRDSAEADATAISYECWTELDLTTN